MTDDIYKINSGLRLCLESPYKFWLETTQQFHRKCRFKTNQRLPMEAADGVSCPEDFL